MFNAALWSTDQVQFEFEIRGSITGGLDFELSYVGWLTIDVDSLYCARLYILQ